MARVIFRLIAGQLKVHRQELVRELLYYPHKGDQRAVRPTVRATEGALSSHAPVNRQWIEEFWHQCMRETPCLVWDNRQARLTGRAGTTLQRVEQVLTSVAEHSLRT